MQANTPGGNALLEVIRKIIKENEYPRDFLALKICECLLNHKKQFALEFVNVSVLVVMAKLTVQHIKDCHSKMSEKYSLEEITLEEDLYSLLVDVQERFGCVV